MNLPVAGVVSEAVAVGSLLTVDAELKTTVFDALKNLHEIFKKMFWSLILILNLNLPARRRVPGRS